MNMITTVLNHPPIRQFNLLCGLLLLSACALAEPGLQIANAWIAEAPPSSKVMAGYMDIKNPTDTVLEITKVASADFSSIEIHRTVHEDGMARMLRQTGISVPANGSFELKPGGYHLMMFNPARAFKAGDSTQLIFTLADGSTSRFDVSVKKATGYADNGHH